tara:strand:+ start:41961 stop:42143 length:183 start_codon:yes stop_codon:yes gene_type:complete
LNKIEINLEKYRKAKLPKLNHFLPGKFHGNGMRVLGKLLYFGFDQSYALELYEILEGNIL